MWDLLLGIINTEGVPSRVLTHLGAAPNDILQVLEIEDDEEYNEMWEENVDYQDGSTRDGSKDRESMLGVHGVNLTQLANEGKLCHVVGRQKELADVIEVLNKMKKGNPCLIGEPGVGKTTVVEGLALLISKGQVPMSMQGKQVYSIDLASIVAGTKYRGEFDDRFKKDIIIFLDEVHTLIGAGSAEGTIDAANIVKPYLARGQTKLIHSKEKKSIDCIDLAGSRVRIGHEKISKVQTEVPTVEETDIEGIITSWTGIPVKQVSIDESGRLLKMEEALHKQIIGQDEAVKAVSRAIRRACVGLNNPNRPIASFIFSGPTGVGKSELAKALATCYFGSEEAMIRLDMCEFMKPPTMSKLVGTPPGYTGHTEGGGQLTQGVRRCP